MDRQLTRQQVRRKAFKKILFVFPVSDLGGAVQYILSIIRSLPRNEFNIHMATSGNGPLCEVLQRERVRLHQLPANYSPGSLVQAVASFRKFLRQEQFEIVHAHTARAGFLSCLANLGLDARVVYTGHGFRFTQKKFILSRLLFYLLERFMCATAEYVTVLSQSEYEYGIAKRLFDRSKAQVVSMSIDIEQFSNVDVHRAVHQKRALGIPPDAFVVGMVGRISFQKDPTTFVKAAALVNERLPNAWFLWVGDGELRDEMTSAAQRLGIANKVVITGHRDRSEIPILLSIIDVLLFTSRFEGLPIALLEAMAARKLIVAARVGSIHDVIHDGVTGWLFDAGDYQNAASIIEHLFQRRADLTHIQEAASRLIAENYAPEEKMTREFESVYEKVLSEFPR